MQNDFVKLRALEPADLRTLYRWENDMSIWDVGNVVNPLSQAVLQAYIRSSHNNLYQDMQLRMMVDSLDGKTVGCVDLYDFEPRTLKAGISLLIDKQYRGKGYAYQTMLMLEHYAFDFLHLHQLYAFIPVNNKASISLFEKLGYQQSAVIKDWVLHGNTYDDVIVFQHINAEH